MISGDNYDSDNHDYYFNQEKQELEKMKKWQRAINKLSANMDNVYFTAKARQLQRYIDGQDNPNVKNVEFEIKVALWDKQFGDV